MLITKRLLNYAILLSVSFTLVLTTSCEKDDDPIDENTITVKFANRFDSTHEITGFWLKEGSDWGDESLIPAGNTLEPGKYFVFELSKEEDLHYYRVSVEYDSEPVIFDEYGDHGLSISTFVGEENIRYARIRIVGDPPSITSVGCSAIRDGDFWDDDYDKVQW